MIPEPRLSAPRIPPVEPESWEPSVTALVGAPEGGSKVLNALKTLAGYPDLLRRMSPWGGHLFLKTSLTIRDREMVILRTCWRCQSAYEWAQHRALAEAAAGLTEADFEAVVAPATRAQLEWDQVLLAATDQLLEDHFIDAVLWAALSERLDHKQLMDLVFTVGHYASMCAAWNTFGVQLES